MSVSLYHCKTIVKIRVYRDGDCKVTLKLQTKKLMLGYVVDTNTGGKSEAAFPIMWYFLELPFKINCIFKIKF